jgi:hypothetical protein
MPDVVKQPYERWQNSIMRDKSKSRREREEQSELAAALKLNDYVPFWPNNLQISAILSTEREILLGGEARSGKSTAALMKALCNIVVPGYRATFFRETERELLAPGGLVHTIRKWLEGSDAEWNDKLRTMNFPRFDSSLEFGFLSGPGDERRYLGFERQLFDFEELTNYKFKFDSGDGSVIWNPYQFLLRSQSKPPDMPVDVQVFSTTNPGGASEPFVRRYFLPPEPRGLRQDIPNSKVYMIWQPPNSQASFGGRLYLHGVWRENPGIDHATYAQSEAMADDVTRAQQFQGIWGVVTSGGVFKTRELRNRIVYTAPKVRMQRRRGWDKAGTTRAERIDGPRSAGVLMSRIPPGLARHQWGDEFARVEFVIEHGVAGRWSADQREDNIDAIAMGGDIIRDNGTILHWEGDGKSTRIDHEQEPGSGGKQQAQQTTTRLIGLGFIASHERVTGEKETRAFHLAAAVNAGMVAILDDGSGYVDELLAEFTRFPNGVIDYVDASSLVFNHLTEVRPREAPSVGGQRRKASGFVPA